VGRRNFAFRARSVGAARLGELDRAVSVGRGRSNQVPVRRLDDVLAPAARPRSDRRGGARAARAPGNAALVRSNAHVLLIESGQAKFAATDELLREAGLARVDVHLPFDNHRYCRAKPGGALRTVIRDDHGRSNPGHGAWSRRARGDCALLRLRCSAQATGDAERRRRALPKHRNARSVSDAFRAVPDVRAGGRLRRAIRCSARPPGTAGEASWSSRSRAPFRVSGGTGALWSAHFDLRLDIGPMNSARRAGVTANGELGRFNKAQVFVSVLWIRLFNIHWVQSWHLSEARAQGRR
jgi:hypothetical protein